MLASTKAIVLNSTKFGDTALITRLFTEEKGVVSVISNRGKAKSNKNSRLKVPFSLVDIVFYFKNNTQVHRVKEVSNDKDYNSTNTDIIKSSTSFFLAEFLSKIIREEESNHKLFLFLREQSLQLNQAVNVDANFILEFISSILPFIGIEPHNEGAPDYFDYENGIFTSVQPTHKNYCKGDLSQNIFLFFEQKSKLNRVERNACIDALLDYCAVQLQQSFRLKSKEVLDVVFS